LDTAVKEWFDFLTIQQRRAVKEYPRPGSIVAVMRDCIQALTREEQAEVYRWMHEVLGMRIY
jgi:hypothetical protein